MKEDLQINYMLKNFKRVRNLNYLKLTSRIKSILIFAMLFLTVCTAAQTAKTTYEAETSVVSSSPVEKTASNASGGKVYGTFTNIGNSQIRYNIINGGAAGGPVNLIVRYSNGTGKNQSLTYSHYIIGSPVGSNQITFAPTADWNTFSTVTVCVYITPGANQSLKFQKVTGSGSANLDDQYNATGGDPGPDIDSFTLSFVNWTGATSNDYNTASNWYNNEVPPSSAIINIPSGCPRYPILTANITIAGGVIASGASLTINSGASLTVTGSSVSNCFGTLFTSGTTTNTGTLTSNGTITNNGDLILQSNASGTAYLWSASSVNNVTQQRYMTSNQRGWRLLSSPMASTTFPTLASASNILLGPNYTGQHNSVTNAWSSASGYGAMNYNSAYKVFITGLAGESPTYASGPTNVTLVNKGTAANSAPSTITTVAGRNYLVANPYTAPISAISIIAASTGLSNTVSYHNPTKSATNVKVMAGGYDVKTLPSGTTPSSTGIYTDLLIPPMGAIFFYATTSGSINVPKTAIFTGMSTVVDINGNKGTIGVYNHKTAQKKVALPIALPIALTIDVVSDGVNYDQLLLRFKEVGTEGTNVDFSKMSNTYLDFYSINNNKNMAVSELELKDQVIPLGITSTLQKTFTFKVVEHTIPAGFEAVLFDSYLNKETVLAPEATYSFAIDSNTASQGNTRFAIILRTAGALSVKANELESKIRLWPNPARNEVNITNSQNANDGLATIEISDLQGRVIHTQKSNPGTTTSIQTKSWAAGVYILKATNNGRETIKKLLIE